MAWYWYIVILGVSQALYGFRMALKYFQFLEGSIRNGTIITNAIGAGLIWPITLVLDGFRGIWEEIGPVKVVEVDPHPTHDTPFGQFDPTKPIVAGLDIKDVVGANALENLQ